MVLGGDPGRAPSDVTLENWQSAAQLHWTFQHIADFLPTAVISRGTGAVAELPPAPGELSGLSSIRCSIAPTASGPPSAT